MGTGNHIIWTNNSLAVSIIHWFSQLHRHVIYVKFNQEKRYREKSAHQLCTRIDHKDDFFVRGQLDMKVFTMHLYTVHMMLRLCIMNSIMYTRHAFQEDVKLICDWRVLKFISWQRTRSIIIAISFIALNWVKYSYYKHSTLIP